MIKIGEFSKLSHLTIKALRFYEKEELLVPAYIDSQTNYRYYNTSQLQLASKIKAYRQLGFSIQQIKQIVSKGNEKEILKEKLEDYLYQKEQILKNLSILNYLMEENMNNQITIKNIPASIVYYSQTTLKKREEILSWIPEVGKACKELNPSLKCTEPYYGFCEYLDGEYKEEDVWVRYSEAVMEMGKESDSICFKELPATKVLSIYHCGSYDHMEQAYSSILKYARENGYKITGLPRESYIDGIWNKESVEDWLTEVQLPIE